MDPIYTINEKGAYEPNIRALQDTDEASASKTFNPLIEKLINNTHVVKKEIDKTNEKLGASYKTFEHMEDILSISNTTTIPEILNNMPDKSQLLCTIIEGTLNYQAFPSVGIFHVLKHSDARIAITFYGSNVTSQELINRWIGNYRCDCKESWSGWRLQLDTDRIINNFTVTKEGYVADARTVKILNDAIAKLQNKPALTAFLNTNDDYIIQQNNTLEQVPFGWKSGKGKGLDLINGSIIITSDDIDYISISAQIYYYIGTNDSNKNLEIHLNESPILRTYMLVKGNYQHINSGTLVQRVKKGDIIKVMVYGKQGDLIKYYNHGTNLTIIAL